MRGSGFVVGGGDDADHAVVGVDAEDGVCRHLEDGLHFVLDGDEHLADGAVGGGAFGDGEVLRALGEEQPLIDDDGHLQLGAGDAGQLDDDGEDVLRGEVCGEEGSGLQAEFAVVGIDGEEGVFGAELQLLSSADEGAHGADHSAWGLVVIGMERRRLGRECGCHPGRRGRGCSAWLARWRHRRRWP